MFDSKQNKRSDLPKQHFFPAVRQAVVLVAISVLLALSVNYFRNDRLPLLDGWNMKSHLKTPSGKRLDISLTEARKLFKNRAAVFLDARRQEDYEKGHIKEARSLPWTEIDRQFMPVMKNISPDAWIITYCDGEACELSHNLAIFLMDMGFENVRVLINGWALWRESNLPVE